MLNDGKPVCGLGITDRLLRCGGFNIRYSHNNVKRFTTIYVSVRLTRKLRKHQAVENMHKVLGDSDKRLSIWLTTDELSHDGFLRGREGDGGRFLRFAIRNKHGYAQRPLPGFEV